MKMEVKTNEAKRPAAALNPLKFRAAIYNNCLLYTSPSPRDPKTSRMPSSA